MKFMKNFISFYHNQFLPEHSNKSNVALHVVGTLLSAIFLIWALAHSYWWLVLLYPIVHGVPGIIGHRMFERDNSVGDLRINRRDFPLWWFIIANHILTYQIFLRAFTGRKETT
ncbi:MAG TPA: Mpo1-like protein [Oligoflexus sp.]|uniref:Mpo1-like protein n=1 Tax=Oligoflexus sp. TaxID=1971216 RepID=UPI002D373397|nr:Mpo1-like protein [Oligoflexus sp.]HYX34106.1 Mpo1-like protein [Oligoflexus sp.]